MKTILATAYAVNPYKGSEDGMGFNFIVQIARYNKVIAITRENNKNDIEKYLKEQPVAFKNNIQFLYFDLPYWMRFWKRKNKGALLYFYLWQFCLPRFINKQSIAFDIVHNLNFHNDWTPSFLWKLNKPFVWGPIGHHPIIPKPFLQPQYGTKAYILDRVKWIAKLCFWNIDPFLKTTASKASIILAMNSAVADKLTIDKSKILILPSVGSDDMQGVPKEKSNTFNVISVGRFVPLKGFDVCIKSFALFRDRLTAVQKNNVKLTLVGKGPLQATLQSIIDQNNLTNVVEFVPWINRNNLKDLYAASDVFLFPSHEGAGMVVAEALSNSLPIICFDNEGPGELVSNACALKVPYTNYNISIENFANHLHTLYLNEAKKIEMGKAARKLFIEKYIWQSKGDMLHAAYQTVTI